MLALAAAASTPSPVPACTAFLLERPGGVVVGKSYDYPIGHGLIMVNPRGLKKFAMRASGRGPFHGWVSRFGSVTFNQYGRELPVSGMNEAGLVVEVLWLDETRYEPPDERRAVQDLQWMQLQLDVRESVADLLAHIAEVRVESLVARVHFLACDGTGACAAIEFLDGVAVVTTGNVMPVRVLTNDSYAESLEYLRVHRGFGGDRAPASGAGSLDRFVRAARAVAGTASGDPGDDQVARAFSVLDDVSQGSGSVWNLVHEPRERRIHYRTHATPRIKRIDLADFDFECASGARVLDVDAERWGRVAASFLPYTEAANRRIVVLSFSSDVISLPRAAISSVASFPGRFTCAPGP
ncbi:MAG: linear amide C-N hydrolase [Acidobacteriota bacterium]